MENKNNNIIIFCVVFLVIGFIAGSMYSKKNIETNIMETHVMPDGQVMSNSSMMGDSMNQMMAGLNGKTGDNFDKAFLSEMIMHHEGAVLMAEAALKYAKHEEIKEMSKAIINTQTKEIDQMKEWLKNWYKQ